MSVYKIVVYDNANLIEDQFWTSEELEDIISAIEDNLSVYPSKEEHDEANEGDLEIEEE
jgi:hypothetical protein